MIGEKSKITFAELVAIILSFLSLLFSIITLFNQNKQYKIEKAALITFDIEKFDIDTCANYTIQFKNIGESEATHLKFDFDFYVLDSNINHKIFDRSKMPPNGYPIQRQESHVFSDTTTLKYGETAIRTNEDLQMLLKDQCINLFLVCSLQYTDRFSQCHWLQYVYKFNPAQRKFQPRGGMCNSGLY